MGSTSTQKHSGVIHADQAQVIMDSKRSSVIGLFLAGKSPSAILRELHHLDVNRSFVYRTIKRYNETGSIKVRHRGGHQRTATSADLVKKVKQRLKQNPKQSARQIAKELQVSKTSIQRILRENFVVRPYKMQPVLELNDHLSASSGSSSDSSDSRPSSSKSDSKRKQSLQPRKSKHSSS